MNAVQRMEQAGFRLRIVDGRLQVAPADRLSDVQRTWLRRHKGTVTLALLARDDPGLRLLVETFGVSEAVTIGPDTAPPSIAPMRPIASAHLEPVQVEQALAILRRLYREHEARLIAGGCDPRSALVQGGDYLAALRRARLPMSVLDVLQATGRIVQRGPYLQEVNP